MLERLKNLEDNIFELKKYKKETTEEDIEHNRQKEWVLRYGLLETIQIVIDVSCHVVNKYNLGNPGTYQDCIKLLLENKYLEESLYKKLQGMIGLRNILIHEYVRIDVSKLYNLLENLDDFKEFAYSIKEFLK